VNSACFPKQPAPNDSCVGDVVWCAFCEVRTEHETLVKV